MLDDSFHVPTPLSADPRALVVPGESIFPLGEQIDPPQGADARHHQLHVHPDMLQILLATSGACFCEIDGLRLAGRAPMLILYLKSSSPISCRVATSWSRAC